MPRHTQAEMEELLQAGLVDGRVPVLSLGSWPGDAVYCEFLCWLDRHPEIDDWCRGNAEAAQQVIRLLRGVVGCVRKKLGDHCLSINFGGDKGYDLPGMDSESEVSADSSAIAGFDVDIAPEVDKLAQRPLFLRFLRRRKDREDDAQHGQEVQLRRVARNCFESRQRRILRAAADCGLLRELVESLGFSSIGWDLSQGSLKKTDLTRLRSFLHRLEADPLLKQVLEDLGRLERSAHGHSTVFSEFIETVSERRKLLRECVVPRVEIDVTGVDQSDDLQLMLPDELVFLAQKTLRPLWYQRFAEGQLSTWRVQGTEIEETEHQNRVGQIRQTPVRTGPVVVLLDTSGSMADEQREPTAKATVLLLCRIAQARQRRIFIISFSGPGQTLDFEFTPDAAGLLKLDQFLGWSFSGGTDVDEPLQRSLKKCSIEADWKTADVAILSDGCFNISDETVRMVDDCRKNSGLEVTALLTDGCASEVQRICPPSRIRNLPEWKALRDEV